MAEVYWEENKSDSSIKFKDFKGLTNLEKIKEAATEYDFGGLYLKYPLLLEITCRVRLLNGEDLTDINTILIRPTLSFSKVYDHGYLCLFNLCPEHWQVHHRQIMLNSIIKQRVFTVNDVFAMAGKVKNSTNVSYFYLRPTIRALEHGRVKVFNALLNRLSTSYIVDYKKVFKIMSNFHPYRPITESQSKMCESFLVFAHNCCYRHSAFAVISNVTMTQQTGSGKVYQPRPVTVEDIKLYSMCDFRTKTPTHLSEWNDADWLAMAKAYWESNNYDSSIEFDDFEGLTNLEKIKAAAIAEISSGGLSYLNHPLLLEAACRVRALNGADLTGIKKVLNDPALYVSNVYEHGCLCLFNLLNEERQAKHGENMLYYMIGYRVFTDDEFLNMIGKLKSDNSNASVFDLNLHLTISALEYDRCDVFNAAFTHYSKSFKIHYNKVFQAMSNLQLCRQFTRSQLEMLDRFLTFAFSDEKAKEYLPYLDEFMANLNKRITDASKGNNTDSHLLTEILLYIRDFLDDTFLNLIDKMFRNNCKMGFMELFIEQKCLKVE